jgi:hypothetical protein
MYPNGRPLEEEEMMFNYMTAKAFLFGEVAKMEGYLINFKLGLKVRTGCAYSKGWAKGSAQAASSS